jgi:succinate dehydrogenase / fumarate reductase cytochrome b subunit
MNSANDTACGSLGGRSCRCYIPSIVFKAAMAVSGLAMVGFLVGHLIGNLKVFQGFDPITGTHKLDTYAAFLRQMGAPAFSEGELLWIARIALLVAVFVHIVAAIALTNRSNAARPIGYTQLKSDASTYASRTMRWGGIIILCYIVYHLLHFTFGTLHLHGFVHGRVYANLYYGFKVWYVVVIYLISMAAIAAHLYHGFWSAFQTLGISHARTLTQLKCVAKLLSIALFLGYSAIPLAVWFDFLPHP